MSELTNLLEGVKKYAPILASAIPIPGASAIVSLICSAFGGTPNDIPAVLATMEGDPDAPIKLKTIEDNTLVQLHQIQANVAIADIQAVTEDTKDARALKVSTNSPVPDRLTYMVTIGFFSVIVFMCSGNIPSGNETILNVMLGSLGSGYATVIGYWLGSSKSSSEKNDMLINAGKK